MACILSRRKENTRESGCTPLLRPVLALGLDRTVKNAYNVRVIFVGQGGLSLIKWTRFFRLGYGRGLNDIIP